ncbi:MAG: recombinase family protein [Acidobacteriota bacterium]|nr:recombinase family protein [Acidobacteriota bacterium]
MIAAIYARKSTAQDDVAEEAKSVTRQVDGARAFIQTRGWTLDEAHVYKDDNVSGTLFANRAEFQRMMRDAAAGAFDAVVFFDLDRFGRNASKTMVALNTLADLGVSIWDYSTGLAVDLDSFAGETMTFLKARFAQEQREQARKHTREAMRQKAKQGYVTGGKVFGYDNVFITKGQTDRRINDAEAAIVRDIYTRFAGGEGARTIAEALNRKRVPTIRAQRKRPSGWGPSTIRAVLERPLYRGQIVYGRMVSAYGRELGKRVTRKDGTARECGQLPRPEDTWIQCDAPHLRIIEADLAARVDARRLDRRTRYLASVARGDGRVPERAYGKYLLSGGMLVCPQCGGHFEARKHPWHDQPGEVYTCSTRRRKPGMCDNMMALPIGETDDQILSIIDGQVLCPSVIEELLLLVDRGEADDSARLTADRQRLCKEISRFVDSIAEGKPPAAITAAINEREAEVARLDVKLRTPRPARPNIDKLRQALTLRAKQWKADLRAEPQVARLLVRRLMGPLVLHDEAPDWIPFEAPVKAGLLDGLQPTLHVASPRGFEPVALG